MWGNNRVVAPTPGAAIIAIDLGDNFTIKGHHLHTSYPRCQRNLSLQPIARISSALKLDWSKEIKAKPIRTTVAFAESSNESKLMEKIEALTTKIDSQFKDIKGEMKEMRDGCKNYRGPHPSLKCNDKPLGGPKDEEANYAYEGYRGGEDTPSIPPTPEKKFDEFDFEKTMREFMVAQKSSNDFVKNQFFNLKTKVEQGKKNHQALIKDLETKFGRLFDQCSSQPTGSLLMVWNYDSPVNLNATTTVIHDDSEDEADEAEKEVESTIQFNDDTCFRMDVIDEVTEKELDALLDDSEPFSTTLEKINKSYLDHEFEEFMAIKIEEIPEQEEEAEDNLKNLPLDEI
ncbi:hypothetical protein Tco_0421218 [Tanacetum coccineum]